MPRIILVAYLFGVWWWLAARLDDTSLAVNPLAAVVLAPLVILGGPWYLLIDDDQRLPLLLTYGVFALWYGGRRLLVSLEARRPLEGPAERERLR